MLQLSERIIRVEEELKAQRELMKQGFDQMEKRFEQIDKRFEQVDKRFDTRSWRSGSAKPDDRARRGCLATRRFCERIPSESSWSPIEQQT